MTEVSKVNLYSDGTPNGIKLITDDGKVLEHVTEIAYSQEAGNFAELILTIRIPSTQFNDITVREINFTCPLCNGDLVHNCFNPEDDWNNNPNQVIPTPCSNRDTHTRHYWPSYLPNGLTTWNYCEGTPPF